MDTVNGIRCNIYRTLETEGHIRSPQIVVNGLGQGYHIQPFCAQEVCGLMGSVPA